MRAVLAQASCAANVQIAVNAICGKTSGLVEAQLEGRLRFCGREANVRFAFILLEHRARLAVRPGVLCAAGRVPEGAVVAVHFA